MADINDLKRQYKGEWLAIAVTRDDEGGPSQGELISHSRDHDEAWAHIQGDPRRIYVTYAGPPIPEGHAAAF